MTGRAALAAGFDDEAIKRHRAAICLNPDRALAYHELSLALAAKAGWVEALFLLYKATAIAPDFSDAWRAMAQYYARLGNRLASDAAYLMQINCAITHSLLKRAQHHLRQGQATLAATYLTEFLRSAPEDPVALRLLATSLAAQGRLVQAESCLAKVIALVPSFWLARRERAACLIQLGRGADALVELDALAQTTTRDPTLTSLRILALQLLGEHGEACLLQAEMLAGAWQSLPQAWLDFGHTLYRNGQKQQSGDAFRRALALRPGDGAASWGLVGMAGATLSPDSVAAITSALANPAITPENRADLHFTLGRIAESQCDWQTSFAHYDAGNLIRCREKCFDSGAWSRAADQLIDDLDADFFAERRAWGDHGVGAIFIVGMAGSGVGLVEAILARHRIVDPARRSSALPSILAEQSCDQPARQAAALKNLTLEQSRSWGGAYLAIAKARRRTGSWFFVDGRAENFYHLGLIALILPQARIIDLRRHKKAAGFTRFAGNVGKAAPFSAALPDIASHHADHARLMAHFARVLPGRILRISYEQLMAAPEPTIRAMLDFCGLAFDANCCDFTPRPSQRWRSFEPWLSALGHEASAAA